MKRPILLLYDNDVHKLAEDHGQVHVRAMPSNAANAKIANGIENLLPTASLTADMYDTSVQDKQNGTTVTTQTLNKMKLCQHLCKVKRDAADFTGFNAALDLVEGLIPPTA